MVASSDNNPQPTEVSAICLDATGWFAGADHCPSPNFGPRPDGTEVNLLLIHNISLPPGEFGGGNVQRLFQNCLDKNAHPYFEEICDMQVSSHLLIDRQGRLSQFVSLADRAWHAGESSFCGESNCNDFSIGIELEGTDTTPYSDEQYDSLVRVSRVIMAAYPALVLDRVVGHCDVAPGRKTDPGPAFDWPRYRAAMVHNEG